jgi:putative spermidine/putrescine transport system permease protein
MAAVKAGWGSLLVVPFVISAGLLFGSQFVFLRQSLHRDLRFGQQDADWSLAKFRQILTDPYYLHALWLTTYISLAVALICVVVGFPIAKVLARQRSRWTTALLSTIVLTSFITTVIQIFGLIIIFRGDGPVNQLLRVVGLARHPFELIGTPLGVILGLVYASFGFAVMLMYGIVLTIPVSLDEAAAVHGASRLRVLLRVVLPLCAPGLIIAFLTIFNSCMGSFTSAALLGGGRVLTLPVLIQRTMLLDVKYGIAGALAGLLLLFVVVLNLACVAILGRFRMTRAAAL